MTKPHTGDVERTTTFGGEWLDSIEALHTWLGRLIAETPAIASCSVFTSDGDGLRAEHFHWCDTEGGCVDNRVATEVTIATFDIQPTAVNSHAALVAAVKEARDIFEPGRPMGIAEYHQRRITFIKRAATLLTGEG